MHKGKVVNWMVIVIQKVKKTIFNIGKMIVFIFSIDIILLIILRTVNHIV